MIPTNPHRKRIGLVALIVAVLFAAGCSATVEPESKTAAPASAPADPGTPPAQPDSTEPGPADNQQPPDPGIAKVGASEWFEYDDGVQVQVTSLETFTLGEYAISGSQGDTGVIATVTIKNGTGGVFDASMCTVLLTYGPNGNATEREYNEYGFEGSIPPGKTRTAKYDFGTVPGKHLDELMVEVSPSWDHAPAFFEGGAN